jgi:hypothetical protein
MVLQMQVDGSWLDGWLSQWVGNKFSSVRSGRGKNWRRGKTEQSALTDGLISASSSRIPNYSTSTGEPMTFVMGTTGLTGKG